ncbi:hypothetical protein MBRA1_001438 [Malassezia brasiliensis]|uniref:Uncharacterized protein n=1 Tax=Malassezia brasiliensis TaxID=1821822 RepID=A0AAF0INB8_9BASI|nr:hypothetical protein MBRA1_001438 [Malassezia brasiliensis]
MHVAVHGASHNSLTLAWADTQTGAPPDVYVDGERRMCAAAGAHFVVPRLEPGVAYTLHAVDGDAPAVYLTRPSLAPLHPARDEPLDQDTRELQHEIDTLRKAMARQAAYEHRQQHKIEQHYADAHALHETAERERNAASALASEAEVLERDAADAQRALEVAQALLADAEQQAAHEKEALAATLQRHEHAREHAARDVEFLQQERDALQGEIQRQRAQLPYERWSAHRRTSSYQEAAWAALPPHLESPTFQFPRAPRDEAT